MAITYPRELPSYSGLQKCIFGYYENVSSSPFGKGKKFNLSNVLDETWDIDVLTGLLDLTGRYAWSAWRKSLKGGQSYFVAYDITRLAPGAYLNAKSAATISAGWSGTATVTALGASGALGLSGLPVSYKFKAGDRIGLEQSGSYGYYEIIEDVTASASGVATVSVMPFLHTSIFTTAAVARIFRPKAKFSIDWTSWTESGDSPEPSPISFKGFQVL